MDAFIIGLDANREGKFYYFDSPINSGMMIRACKLIECEVQAVIREYKSFYRIDGPKG